jgi:hypothetical protein
LTATDLPTMFAFDAFRLLGWGEILNRWPLVRLGSYLKKYLLLNLVLP